MQSHRLALLLASQPLPLEGRLLADFAAREAPVLLDPSTGGALTDDRPVFILSTEREATDCHILRQFWDLSRVSGAGVPILVAHEAEMLPVGQWQDLAVVDLPDLGRVLTGRAFFDPEDVYAQTCKGKVKRGFLRSVSVGWKPGALVRRGDLSKTDPLYREPMEDECGQPCEGFVMGTAESPNILMEGSLCAVPADPNAIATQRLYKGAERGLRAMQRGDEPNPGDLGRLLAVLANDPRVRIWVERRISSMMEQRITPSHSSSTPSLSDLFPARS